MGSAKKFTKKFKKLSTLDWISLATALPLSAANPLKPLDKIMDIAGLKPEELEMPGAPPPPPEIAAPVLDEIQQVAPKKKKKYGRGSTILTSPSGLSDTSTAKPTLLGQ